MNALDAKTATTDRPSSAHDSAFSAHGSATTHHSATVSDCTTSADCTGSAAAYPHGARAFRRIRQLIGGHIALSVLTLAVAAVLHGHTSVVTPAVWIRGSLVAAGGVVLALCAARAARGSRGAYRRLRILSAVTLAAIVAIVSVPGALPGWMKIEQGLCGLALVATVAIVNSRAVRQTVTGTVACTATGTARS